MRQKTIDILLDVYVSNHALKIAKPKQHKMPADAIFLIEAMKEGRRVKCGIPI